MKTFTTATLLVASAVAANAACTPTKSDACNSISSGGLLNLGLLGCSDFKVNPVIDIFRRSDESSEEFVARAEMERALTSAKKTDACKSLSSAGFLNLNLFGCSKFDVSPKVHIFRRDGTAGTPGSAGSAGSAGSPGVKGTPGVPGSKNTPGQAGTPGTPGTPGTAGSPGVPGVPGTAGTPGTPGTPGTVTTKSATKSTATATSTATTKASTTKSATTSTPSTTAACPVPVSKSSCNDLSKAGLINLDLLGCFLFDVSPTIKVGQSFKNFFH
ncbi:unnamed protein product [Tilletia laevis]|uniref:Hydrophobin n=1 Tax=Tilletia laevis TaxID=157183 RepID=A0A9N8LD34_9BASI|nr:unnamed protein product [Tilletia laevis]